MKNLYLCPSAVMAGILFLLLPAATVQSQSLASGQPRIAIIKSGDIEPYNLAVEGIQENLRTNGFDPEYFSCNLKEQDDDRVGNIFKRKPELILAVGSEASIFCRDNFPGIPAVFFMVLFPPSGSGASEKSAMTGVVLRIPVVEQFRQFKDIVPDLETVGMLYDAEADPNRIKEISGAARKTGLELIARPVKSLQDISETLRKVLSESDSLWAEPVPRIYSSRTAREIILTTLRKKIPFMAFSSGYVRAGALLALECDYLDIGKQSGEIAVRILKGENPGTIPVEYPRKTNLVINERTAKTIDLEIPLAIYEKASQIYGR